MRKLKNCYYEKVLDDELGHYFQVYDLNRDYLFDCLLWDTVLTYNKNGDINE